MWFDPGFAGLFITSTLLHLGEDINLLVVSVSSLFGSSVLLSIYREKKELVLLLVRLGSGFRGRLVGHWARLSRRGLSWFWQRGWRSASVFGRWPNGVGPRVGRWAWGKRGADEIKQQFFFLLPRCMFGGEEERGTVPLKTAPFGPFFLMYETTSFWIKRAVSFKGGARTCQFSNQPSIIFCSFQLHPF